MTSQSVRGVKAACDVAVGDWFAPHETAATPVEVTAITDYAGATGPAVRIDFRAPNGEVGAWQLKSGEQVALATPAELGAVAAAADCYSVAAYVADLRKHSDAYAYAFGVARYTASALDLPAEERLRRINNVAAAVDVINEELTDRLEQRARLLAESAGPAGSPSRVDIDVAKFAGGWTAAAAQASGDDDGFGYGRDAGDDPTPVSPARVPMHVGLATGPGELVEHTPPAPIAAHYETNAWSYGGVGGSGVDCACGIAFGGFDSIPEAAAELKYHITVETAAVQVDEQVAR